MTLILDLDLDMLRTKVKFVGQHIQTIEPEQD